MEGQQRLPNRLGCKTPNLCLIVKPHLPLGRVNVDIHAGRINAQKETAYRVSSLHQCRVIAFKQGKLKEAIAQWQASLKEWDNASPSELEPAEVAKVQKKLEGARVRLAKESPERR